MIKKFALFVAIVAIMLTVAACGSDEPDNTNQDETQTAPNGDTFNDADVAFATGMIPHHAQALAMVDLTTDRLLDPKVEQLAEAIRGAQAPEIETMADWLTAWDKPVPQTMRGHGGMDMDTDTDMPGMMSDQDMADLESADDAEFQDMWLTMMIKHHEGAVEMAQTEQSDGKYEPAIQLATAIESSQNDEIDLMQDLLAS